MGQNGWWHKAGQLGLGHCVFATAMVEVAHHGYDSNRKAKTGEGDTVTASRCLSSRDVANSTYYDSVGTK